MLSFSGACVALSGQAHGAGAWVASSTLTPTEQRLAVAVGPGRTTVWTSLRFESTGGAVGVLLPAPPGSSVDLSSDAWFEALEVATAPRVFPPVDVSPFCPGKSGSPTVFSIAGQVGHTPSLPAQDVTVLADVSAVSAWAAQDELVISPQLLAGLSALSGVGFVGVRFTAPSGASVTPTLRVSMPGTPAMLPLALTAAGSGDLRVSAWVIGQGEASLVGANQVATAPASLVWKAGAQASNYDALTGTTLASASDTFLVESTSHEGLSQNVSIAQGTAFIDGVVTTFFSRAAAYGDGSFDSATCIGNASPALESTMAVAAVCPRAAYGLVDSTAPCTESPGSGQVDPSVLRCGPGADDLALALSDLAPASTWLTRQTLIIPSGTSGADTLLGLVDGAAVSPVIEAATVDVSDCGGSSTSSSSSGVSSSGTPDTSSSSTSSGGNPGTGSGTPSTGSSSMTSSGHGDGSGGENGGGSSGDGAGDAVDAAAGAADGCDGSSDGSCSGSSDGTSDDSSSCDSSSSDSSGDSCSSGSGDSCSSGSSSDSCSGSSGGDSCSGSGDDFKCATAGPHRIRTPRPSIILMLAIAIAAPLRRRGRPSRRAARPKP